MTDDERLLARLVSARKDLGLTQRELGERMGIGQPTVSEMEHSAVVSVATLRRWSKALGLELEIVLREAGEMREER